MRKNLFAISFALALSAVHPALAATEVAPDAPPPSLTESTEAENDDLNWLEKRIVAYAQDPRYRHQLTAFLNKNGGKWVRRMNLIKLKRAWKRTNIPHLEKVSDDVLRGGQPNPKGFQELKDKGVKTVINLRMEDDSERGTCMMLGLRYVYLPLPDTNPPTPEQLVEFQKVMKDPNRGITYIHCAAGTFRTGTMVAVYRMDTGMSYDEAHKELMAHGFIPDMMDAPYQLAFLKDYWKQLTGQQVQKP
jgi:protein tyrosine phosphatase (PTP) superfamily phosphohydrolase (DUF442 family)